MCSRCRFRVEREEELRACLQGQFSLQAVCLQKERERECLLEVYFEDELKGELLALAVEKSFPDLKLFARKVEERDWLSFWRSHFKRTLIGERLWLRPAWEALVPLQEGQVEVIIDPGMSFGTGKHFTTRFCLEQLLILTQKEGVGSVLDVGCGSGILSIAAAKLACAPIVAWENDARALEYALKNAALNDAMKSIDFEERDVMAAWPEIESDYVLANLFGQMLISLAPQLVRAARKVFTA